MCLQRNYVYGYWLGLNVLGPLVNKGVFEHILFWCVAATQQLGIGRHKLGRVVVWVLDVH